MFSFLVISPENLGFGQVSNVRADHRGTNDSSVPKIRMAYIGIDASPPKPYADFKGPYLGDPRP